MHSKLRLALHVQHERSTELEALTSACEHALRGMAHSPRDMPRDETDIVECYGEHSAGGRRSSVAPFREISVGGTYLKTLRGSCDAYVFDPGLELVHGLDSTPGIR